MALDSFDADPKFSGDLFVRFRFADETYDRDLATR
jgi:hypothetical protein